MCRIKLWGGDKVAEFKASQMHDQSQGAQNGLKMIKIQVYLITTDIEDYRFCYVALTLTEQQVV